MEIQYNSTLVKLRELAKKRNEKIVWLKKSELIEVLKEMMKMKR